MSSFERYQSTTINFIMVNDARNTLNFIHLLSVDLRSYNCSINILILNLKKRIK